LCPRPHGSLRVGWKLLKELRKNNNLSLIKLENPPLFLSLKITLLPPSTPLNIHKLTQEEMVEHQLKGLCYNCDEKYFPRHKCKEQNIFMDISKDVSK
jgi:hypothetical protein